MQDALHRIASDVVLFTPRLLGGLGIFAAFWIIAAAVQAVVVRIGAGRQVHRQVLSVLAQGLKMTVVALGAVTALGTTGFNVAGLVAGLGLTGFAVGFALKDVLANVVAGFIILTYRPFRPDDRVVVAGFEGLVTDIDMRYTTLDAGDRRVLVPNSTVLTSAVTVLGPR